MQAAAGWGEMRLPEQGWEKLLQVNIISMEVDRDSSCNSTALIV